jgi:hypothetical protein
MHGSGFLAIWSDLAPEDETDWAHWMTREHSSERVRIEGFLGCRIFRGLGTIVNRYFILYDLDRPEIVGGAQYLARLNAPTPWSQRIMPRLRNFVRGGGRVVATAGIGQGGTLAVWRLQEQPEWDADAVCKEIAALDRIVAARILVTDLEQSLIKTREMSMRSGEASFAGLLLIEGLDENSVRDALWRLRSLALQVDADAIEDQPLYKAVFGLQRPARIFDAIGIARSKRA